MYTPVYENRSLGMGRSLLRAGVGVTVGVLLLLVASAGVFSMVGGWLGFGPYRPHSEEIDADTVPFWAQALFVFGIASLGAFSLSLARSTVRAAKEKAATSVSGQALPFVEGPPRFESDTEGPRSSLIVGGRRFEDVKVRGGRTTGDYAWGTSTRIRGAIRAFYLPETGVLVRAEWREHTALEVTAIVDEIVAKGRAFSPDLTRRIPGIAGVPAAMADAQRTVDGLRALILEDCQRIDALKPSLLPGVPRRERDRAEDEFEKLVTRIDFQKSAINTGLKAARRALSPPV